MCLHLRRTCKERKRNRKERGGGGEEHRQERPERGEEY
jgi:hypothetical protein